MTKSPFQNDLMPARVGPLQKALAVVVAAALLITAPGLPFYQALAAGGIVETGAVNTGIVAGGAVPGGLLNKGVEGGVAVPGAGPAAGLRRQGLKTRLRHKGVGINGLSPSSPARSLAGPSPALRAEEGEALPQVRETQKRVVDAVEGIGNVREIPASEAYAGGQKAIEPLTREHWRTADGLYPSPLRLRSGQAALLGNGVAGARRLIPGIRLGTLEKPGSALAGKTFRIQKGQGLFFSVMQNQIQGLNTASINGKPADKSDLMYQEFVQGDIRGQLGKKLRHDYGFIAGKDAAPGVYQVEFSGTYQSRNDPEYSFSFTIEVTKGRVLSRLADWIVNKAVARSDARAEQPASERFPGAAEYAKSVAKDSPAPEPVAEAVLNLDFQSHRPWVPDLYARRILDAVAQRDGSWKVRVASFPTSIAGPQPGAKPYAVVTYLYKDGKARWVAADNAAARPSNGVTQSSPSPSPFQGEGTQGKGASLVKSALRTAVSVAAGAGLVLGAQVAGVVLMPGAFGLVSYTAAWLVVNTAATLLMWNPVKLRLQLARSEAQGITMAKVLADVAIGMVLGSLFASASVLSLDVFAHLPAALLAGVRSIVQGASGQGVISLAPLLGMAGLAVLSRLADFLPSVTGKREPSKQLKQFGERFLWIAMGIPYALASGFLAPGRIINYAFVAWNLSMGNPKINLGLNVAFLAGWAYAAAVGFATPITFLLIAFTADRAVTLADWVIKRNAQAPGQGKVGVGDDYSIRRFITHPPTGERVQRLESPKMAPGARDPFHYRLKTVLIMGGVFTTAAAILAIPLSTITGFAVPLAIGAALTGVMWYFSDKVALKMFGAVPWKERAKTNPRLEKVYAIVEKLAAMKGIPTPEFYVIPRENFPGPNAFATGRSPKHAVVAVTEGILELMDDRELEGVLAHEMNHVVHRDILLGSITGAVAMAINWSIYNVMWQVTKGRINVGRVVEDQAVDVTGKENRQQPQGTAEFETQVFPAAGVGPFSPALLKVFASIWIPVMVRLLQMAHSRNREFYADEDGALMLGDGKPLADALRKLAGWKPPMLTIEQRMRLPLAYALDTIGIVSTIEQFMGREMEAAPSPGFAGRRVGNGVAPAASGGNVKEVGAEEYPRTPGLDQGLLPTVKALEALVNADRERGARFGHLLNTLREVLASGGSLKFGMATVMTPQGPIPLPAAYDPSKSALVVSETLRRVDPRLTAVLLGQQLQAAHDLRNGRLSPIVETEKRQSAVATGLLEGLDLKILAAGLDINNPSEVSMFAGVAQQKLEGLQERYNPQAVQADGPTAADFLRQMQETVSGIGAELKDLQDQLSLVEDNLAQKTGDPGLARDRKVLQEKIQHVKGTLFLANQSLLAFMKEQPDKLTLTPGAAAPLADLPLLALRKPAVDPKIEPALKALREGIAADPAKTEKLARVLAAIDRVIAEGGRITFGLTPEGAAAFFSPVSLHLVMSGAYEKNHTTLVAAVLAHEGTHAADYFEGKAMTRETEYGAFANEALFLDGVDAEKLAQELDLKNPADVTLYHHVEHVRRMSLEGKISLQAMVSNAYSRQVWTNIEGLLTARQTLEELNTRQLGPLQQGLGEMKKRIAMIEGASAAQRGARAEQLEFLKKVVAVYEALGALYERQKAQYEAAIAEHADAEPAPTAPPSPPARRLAGPSPGSAGRGGFPASFEPLTHLSALKPSGGVELGGLPRVLPPAARTTETAALGPQAPRGGLLSRAWEALKKLVRILQDRSRNRSLWLFFAGQAMIVLGFSLFIGAIPPLSGNNSKVQGQMQAASDSSTVVSGFATAPEVDRRPTRALLAWTGWARGLPLLLIPGIAFTHGHLGLGAFAAAVAASAGVFLLGRRLGWMSMIALAAPAAILWLSGGHLSVLPLAAIFATAAFFQTTSINVSQVTLMKLLWGEEGAYSKANTILKLVANLVAVAGFRVAAGLMDRLDAMFGAGMGPAIVAGLYGVLTILSSVVYSLWLQVPNDRMPVVEARAQGEGSDGTLKAGFRERVREFFQGLGLIARNRFLRLSMIIAAFETGVAKPLTALVIIKYAATLLINGAASQGAYSLLMSYASAGAVVALLLLLGVPALLTYADRMKGKGALGLILAPFRGLNRLIEKLPGPWSNDLERQATLSYWMSGLAHFLFWGFVFTGNFAVAAGLMVAMSLLEESESVYWDSLVNKLFTDDSELEKHRGKVISTINLIDKVLSIAGFLTIGALLTGFAIPAFSVAGVSLAAFALAGISLHSGLWYAAIASSISGLAHVLEPFLVLPLNKKSKPRAGGTKP